MVPISRNPAFKPSVLLLDTLSIFPRGEQACVNIVGKGMIEYTAQIESFIVNLEIGGREWDVVLIVEESSVSLTTAGLIVVTQVFYEPNFSFRI